MILPAIFNWWDENRLDMLAYMLSHLFSLFIIMLITAEVIKNLGLIYFSLLLLLLTEIIYHVEPRSKKEKKNGRGYFLVLFKKLDSAFDGVVLICIGAVLYEIIIMITLEYIIYGLKWVGTIVGTFLIVWVYLWVNRLRDLPKKKQSKIKVSKSYKQKTKC